LRDATPLLAGLPVRPESSYSLPKIQADRRRLSGALRAKNKTTKKRTTKHASVFEGGHQ
jgi:hypothetical protein